LLLASFTEPHDPYLGPKKFWDQYEGVTIDMPSVPFIPREKRDHHSQRVYDCMDNGDYNITEEHITKSRRAYYSMMSYIDSKVGEFVSTLEEQGIMNDTLIVFTADHGDMQGERGMWFKETYHERATRVPLFFYATPAMAEKYNLKLVPGTISHNVSLVDILPTLLHLVSPVGSDWKSVMPSPVEGRSLLPALLGQPADLGGVEASTIYSEYTSEMICGGWFMVKRGCLKLIYSRHDPLLFDLRTDPMEMVNVVEEDAYKTAKAELLELAKGKWPDIEGLALRIVESQRRRRMVHSANTLGKRTTWDYEPIYSEVYIRNTDDSLQAQDYVCRAPCRKRPRH